uniref:Cytochrome P450 n=1 Tax=Echinochloa phyllopogon TaxID=45619 RepID=R4WHE6_9POAL|nr:cytochrome P450 [Echinochloa phyllopogon]
MERFYYVAAVTLVLLVLLHRLLMKRTKRRRLPPGPRFTFPILGHLPLLKKPIQTSLVDLAARYGPVVHLRLGSRHAIVIGSSGVAKECFSGELDVAIANRPHFPSLREVTCDYSMPTVANYGAHWRTMRRVATVHLLSAHRVNIMSDNIIARELRAMVRRLARASAAASGAATRVELKRRLFELSHSVLMEIIAHTRNTYSDDADEDMSKEAREMKDIQGAIVPLVGVANLWDYLPLLRWLDVYGVKRKITDVVNRRNTFVYNMIDAERHKLKQLECKNGQGEGDIDDSDEKKSMIGVMLSLQKTEPDVYTDAFINALVANLLSAGTETTSTTMEWTMSLLLNHPDVLKKAQEEIDSNVGGGRLLDKNDIPHLPYLHCIINETLRLYPVVPMLLPHEASTDCKIHGYDVPAGSMVLVNAYAIHRDPVIWEDPEEFRPERFEHGRAEGKFIMPFGMGRRKCPGENLAMRTMGLVLGVLLQCFDWSRIGDGEVDMATGTGAIMFKAVPLEALCKPRANMSALLQEI